MSGKEIIHVVEVRSLNFPGLQDPYESVNLKKQNKIISAARDYIVRKRVKNEIQFDIVSVIFKSENFIIEYFPDAFAPRW
jgi:putative endonuclease